MSSLRLTGVISHPRRPVALIGGLAVSALALSACSPSHAGAAAVVGGTRISVSQLQASVARIVADPAAASVASPTGDVTTLQRSTLTQLIQYALVAEAAREKNVSASAGDIASLLATAEKSLGGASQLNSQIEQDGIPVSETNQFVQNLVLEQKLEAALTKTGSVNEVHVAHIPVATKALADSILAQVKADPSKFAALAKQYSVDSNTSATGGDLGTNPEGSLPEPLDTDVNTEPVGSYFEVFVESDYDVVHVISRSTVKLSSLDPSSTAAQAALSAALTTSLNSVAKAQGVTVNPRYGSWDAATNSISGDSDVLSSPEAGLASSPVASPAG